MTFCDEIRARLFAMADPDYQLFQSRLMPNLPPERVIGVRTPLLRAYARELSGRPELDSFLSELPHEYYEENNLHSFLLCRMKDFPLLMERVEAFLPHVDNWATCDSFYPPVFRKHPQELLTYIDRWLDSDLEYTVRFGIGLLMHDFLEEHFSPEHPARIAAIDREEYYIRMMIAWYFATAMASQQDAVLPYLENQRLPVWTHNKAIQKCVESRVLSPELKEYLKTLRR